MKQKMLLFWLNELLKYVWPLVFSFSSLYYGMAALNKSDLGRRLTSTAKSERMFFKGTVCRNGRHLEGNVNNIELFITAAAQR